MLFRKKDSTLVNIVRSEFISDIEYYSCIKKHVTGVNIYDVKKDSIIDVIVSLVKKNTDCRVDHKSK